MSHPPDPPPERDAARVHLFTELYTAAAPRVFLYAARHVGPDHADDIVAETFSVAWRRLDDVPRADRALPWLLVVARNVIANHRRSETRRDRLTREAELHHHLSAVTEDVAVDVAERAALLSGLAELSEREREALLLVAWDGLTGPGAATVAGCSTSAFNVRLHRARQRLQRSVSTSPTSDHRTRRTALAPEATP